MTRAWWMGVGIAAAMLAVGCKSTIVNGGCPEAMPQQGDACAGVDQGTACVYPRALCDVTVTCSMFEGGEMWLGDTSVCDRVPVDCWSASEGDPCATPGDSCGESAGPCASGFSNTCGDDHLWHSDGGYDIECCYGWSCPSTMPNEGDPCDPCVDSNEACGFASYCGTDSAWCGSEGVWHTSFVDCPPPPTGDCSALGTEADCQTNAACQWYWPGCGDPALPVAGCFPAIDCAVDACPSGYFCAQAVINPCVNMGCDACGMTVSLCVLAVP